MDGELGALQFALHYGGHFLAPLLIAAVFWRSDWKRAALVMLAANLIDLDHLLADPVFDPGRCSVGYHYLHGWVAGALYALMLIIPRWWARAFSLGALWHLAVDYGDCVMQAA